MVYGSVSILSSAFSFHNNSTTKQCTSASYTRIRSLKVLRSDPRTSLTLGPRAFGIRAFSKQAIDGGAREKFLENSSIADFMRFRNLVKKAMATFGQLLQKEVPMVSASAFPPVIVDQPEFGTQEQDKKIHEETNELVLDGGFVVPESNSFGQTFRDYNAESERKKTVEEFYKQNHINQTFDFVKRMREEYGKLNRVEMSIWECCELLNEFVDESDPDLDEPQIEHLLQTAEAIRKDYPNEDWLHLTGLIHDLGKVLLHHSFGELPQWAVVGDTFPVGCAFDESIVHHKYLKENPDYYNSTYNTKCGIYSEGYGLNNVMMSWGHDDYMYLVAKENKTTLPSAALFIIRYHSFYPLHKAGAYKHLMNEEDVENLKWLHVFNKYDLYSKSKVRIDVEKVKPYYLSLIEKYFPSKLRW